MIATGGLLRINARRQDSLRNKSHKPHPHKKKKKRRRSEVVVVKGKLKLCSLSGLVAALGVLVLLGGVVMATLGYWPRDGLFSAQPQEDAAMALSSISTTPAPAQRGEGQDGGGGADDSLNQTESVNGTSRHLPRSFVEEFLERYLYSDRLKVFGPLIMGIGIFLFICANAVLHENRDKKTKVINLRDIYSTVIDLHSLRRPRSSSTRRSSTNPLNGLINYVQSKSLESKPSSYPASLMSRREGGAGGAGGGALSRQQLVGSSGGGGGVCDGGEDSVFSIFQNIPPPDSSHILPLPTSLSPLPPPQQRGGLSFFTLPLRRPPPATPRRRHSARARTGAGEDECPLRPLTYSTSPSPRPLQEAPLAASCTSSSLPGSQALLLSFSSLSPSHLSLSSLSGLLSSSSLMMKDLPCRRQSLPTGGASIGYSKLTQGDIASLESSEMTSLHQMTSQRKYSNREKLRMISQLVTHDDQSGAESVTDMTSLQS